MTITKPRLLAVGSLIGLALLLAACSAGSAPDATDTATVDYQQGIYQKYQPVPLFDYSLDRDILTQIYTLKNQALSTYTYEVLPQVGVIFSCPSVGFPIAADTQLTNNARIDFAYNGGNSAWESGVVEQAEPNGLYTGGNGNGGTYFICDVNGDKVPEYSEAQVVTSPVLLSWNAQTKTLHPAAGATSSMHITLRSDAKTNAHVTARPTPTPAG